VTVTADDLPKLMADFLTSERGSSWADVPRGKVHEDRGRLCFQMRSLQDFLTRAGARPRRKAVVAAIRAMGGGHGQKTLFPNRHFNIWFVFASGAGENLCPTQATQENTK
jgi:hypothetical protein